jgi:hypothetical protein
MPHPDKNNEEKVLLLRVRCGSTLNIHNIPLLESLPHRLNLKKNQYFSIKILLEID